MRYSTHCSFDDGKEAARDRRNGGTPKPGLGQQVSKLLFRAFLASKGYHHFEVNEPVRVTDGSPWGEHDLDDQYAPVIRHCLAAAPEDLDCLRVTPIMETGFEHIRIVAAGNGFEEVT